MAGETRNCLLSGKGRSFFKYGCDVTKGVS